jgi:NAD(P)-dependent dehydrogenase (short-subunit alcohol dehydrogenase family)
LIFPYHVVSVMTDGGTRKAKGSLAMSPRGKHVASAPRKIRERVDARCDASWPQGRRVPASDDAGYVTGTTLYVDGGMSA